MGKEVRLALGCLWILQKIHNGKCVEDWEIEYLFVDDMQPSVSDFVARKFLENLPTVPRKDGAKVISGTFGTFSVKDFEKIMEERKDV